MDEPVLGESQEGWREVESKVLPWSRKMFDAAKGASSVISTRAPPSARLSQAELHRLWRSSGCALVLRNSAR